MMKPYFTNSLEKIFKTGPLNFTEEKVGVAMNNEKFSIQIVIPPLMGSEDHELNLDYTFNSDLKDALKIFRVDYVLVGNRSGDYHDYDIISSENSIYPDILFPINFEGNLQLNKDEWNSLWVEVDLSKFKNIDYLDIYFNYSYGNYFDKIGYHLEIIDCELPKLNIVHTEWIHADSICQFYDIKPYSSEFWAAIKNYIKMAVQHSQNTVLTPIFTPPLDTEELSERMTMQLVEIFKINNDYEFNFSKLTFWSDILKQLGVKYIEFPPIFSQWGAEYTPKIIVEENGVKTKEFGWHTHYDDKQYKKFMESFLSSLDDWIEENGWKGKAFFHISDEPNHDSIDNYKYGKNLAKRNIKNAIFIDALSDISFYKDQLVDVPVVGTPSLSPFIENNVDIFWCYYCGAHNTVSNRYIAQHSRKIRVLGFQIYKYNIKGFLHWGYNFWFTELSKKLIDPYMVTDSGGAFPSGDAFLVYPGDDFEPIPSLRLKLINEAFQDIQLCELLEKLTDRKTVLNIIDDYLPDLTFQSHGEMLNNILVVRSEISKKIQQIMS